MGCGGSKDATAVQLRNDEDARRAADLTAHDVAKPSDVVATIEPSPSPSNGASSSSAAASPRKPEMAKAASSSGSAAAAKAKEQLQKKGQSSGILSSKSAQAAQSRMVARRMSAPMIGGEKRNSTPTGPVGAGGPGQSRLVGRRNTDVNSKELERFEQWTKAQDLTRKRGRLAVSSETVTKLRAQERMASWTENQTKSAQVGRRP